LRRNDSKAAKIAAKKIVTKKTRLWSVVKSLIFIMAILSAVLNIYIIQHLKVNFSKGLSDIDEDNAERKDGDEADESANAVDFEAPLVVPMSQKVGDIVRLLEGSEASLRPPTNTQKVVVLGKSFILKRDFDIWDYTFKRANHEIVQTTKQDLQQGKYNDWTVMKCLDLFDGKSHCIEPSDLPSLKRYQRVSRLYGLRKTLWNKDRFCETMAAAIRGYDELPLEFVFPCWVLPADYAELIKTAKHKFSNRSFILKPTDRGEGNGIVVMDDWHQLVNWKAKFPDNDEVVVQTYLPNPFLINQRKWDMRTYVLVTSVTPLRVYMYRDGLVRFASSKYEKDAKAGGKATSFLTNTSVNKKAGVAVEDLTWPFPQVYTYLKGIGIDPEMLWDRIEKAVVQLMLSAEPAFVRQFKKLQNDFTCENCYQLLGVDVIVDDDLVPRVIELNGEPSMQLSGEAHSQYDHTKKSMTHDLVQTIYTRDSFASALAQDLTELELDGFSVGYQSLGCASTDEFCLRPVDIEYLLESKKEQQNMGGFRRMYPHAQGAYYTNFIRHLEPKFPYGSSTGTFKIHELVTKLEQLSKVRSKNHWLDAIYHPDDQDQEEP